MREESAAPNRIFNKIAVRLLFWGTEGEKTSSLVPFPLSLCDDDMFFWEKIKIEVYKFTKIGYNRVGEGQVCLKPPNSIIRGQHGYNTAKV